jgi:hypothetical protein
MRKARLLAEQAIAVVKADEAEMNAASLCRKRLASDVALSCEHGSCRFSAGFN